MRPKGTKASFAEIMGGSPQGGKMSLKDLPEILGHDKVMEMPRNAIGKYRLRRALQQRFGDGYRNIPGVKGLMKEFEEDIQFEGILSKVRSIKPQRSK